MRKFEEVSKEFKKLDGQALLPLRGSKTSAGYDFYTTEELVIHPQEKVFFWTDIKAQMPEGEFLMLIVRSSLGVKKDLMLANTIGIGDSDYYSNAGNDGNYGVCLRNLKPEFKLDGYEEVKVNDMYNPNRAIKLSIPKLKDLRKENTVVIPKGERVIQGIFVPFSESDNCNSLEERAGGFGSSGVK